MSVIDKLKEFLFGDLSKRLEYIKEQKQLIIDLPENKIKLYNQMERRQSIYSEIRFYIKFGFLAFIIFYAPSEIFSYISKILTGGI